MIAEVTKILGAENINIANFYNKGRGDYAYSVIDTDSSISDEVAEKLSAIRGVLKVRVVK